MSTLSSRLGLTIPEVSDSMTTGDNMLSDNYDNIDLNCNCRSVANLAAVTAPFNGQHVRSTADSANFFRKNGVWVNSNTVPASSTPYMGSTDTTTATSFTTTEIKLYQFTFNAVVARKYLVHVNVDYHTTGTGANQITQRVRYAAGATVGTSDTLLISKIFYIYVANGAICTTFEFFPNASAQYTLGVFALRTSGAGTFNASNDSTDSNITVMDWGT